MILLTLKRIVLHATMLENIRTLIPKISRAELARQCKRAVQLGAEAYTQLYFTVDKISDLDKVLDELNEQNERYLKSNAALMDQLIEQCEKNYSLNKLNQEISQAGRVVCEEVENALDELDELVQNQDDLKEENMILKRALEALAT